MTLPEVKGRIFYKNDMSGFNFIRQQAKLPISAVADQLLRYSAGQNPPSVAVLSALIPACLPGFEDENVLTALDKSISPRIWMGNTITIPAHMPDRAKQYRLCRQRQTPVHIISTRPGFQPVHRAVRIHAGGRADQYGFASQPRFQTLPEI